MKVVELVPGQLLPRHTPEQPIDLVRQIVSSVVDQGDVAIRRLTKQLDGCDLDSFVVDPSLIESAAREADEDLMAAMRQAAARIAAFAHHQLIQPWEDRIGGGTVGEIVSPVGAAGGYVPGGRATYPSSVLMTAVPAKVAGVGRFAICVPPAADGSVPTATLAAAHVAGVDEIYLVGGAQAVAAMAFGTETIPKVDVIVGPGNIYVALAKKEVAGTVAIDSIAGPSEIVIVADGTADPALIAWDLVAQAEHGPNGAFALVTWDPQLAETVPGEVERLLDELQAGEALRSAVEEGTVVGLVGSLEEAIQAVEAFAPEHLELMFEGAGGAVARFRTAGAIFVGPFSPVSLGDYLAGTNHVLPTAGAARWASGLRASHFQRTSAVVRYDRAALSEAAPYIGALSKAEGLPIHARAVEARLGAGGLTEMKDDR